MKRALLVVAIIAVGCGGDSGISPATPTPVSTRVTVNVTLTETLSGGPLGSVSQEVDRLPATLTLSAAGHLTRQTMIGSASPTVDLIADAAPFDLGFYRQLVRDGFEQPTALQPLRRLAGNPGIYLQTRDLSAANVAALEQAARAIVPTLTGGQLAVAAFETGPNTRSEIDGWIVVDVVSAQASCGLANVGRTAGHIWLSTESRCGYQGNVIDPTIFAHELGHALGFYHVAAPGALMHNPTLRGAVASDAEKYHAAIAYHRQAGNRDPDVDAPTASPLSVRSVIVVD